MPKRTANLRFWIAVATAGWSLAPPISPAAAGVVVTYTTAPHGGPYAPRNVVTAWVEDAGGAFVKTIGRWSGARTSHLVAWIAKAGTNDIDAVSGASRQSHVQPVTATWDLKNRAGNEVPDGTYTIRMELADSNSNTAAQNDQGTYRFVKSASAATQSDLKSGGFTATINYTPNASPTCNNGALDPGETCDPPGSCPTTCAASADACMPNVLVGSTAGCTAACVAQPVTTCANDDGCCAAGCDATSDTDCDPAARGGDLSGGCAADGRAPLTAGWLLLGAFLIARRRR